MHRFLFWNTCKKGLVSEICDLVRERDVDVLVLAENTAHPAALLTSLNRDLVQYRYHPSISTRIRVLSRWPDTAVRNLADEAMASAKALRPPGAQEIVLVGVHYYSKAFATHEDQKALIGRLREFITQVQRDAGHRRIVVVGDFNLDPFSPAMFGSEGLHAVMSAAIAAKKSRIVKGAKRPFLYNPMWSLFGDRTNGPPGTYYFDRSGAPTNQYWHMFDQVLLGSGLAHAFGGCRPEIITHIGIKSLLDSEGIPNKAGASDHLPIMFQLPREQDAA